MKTKQTLGTVKDVHDLGESMIKICQSTSPHIVIPAALSVLSAAVGLLVEQKGKDHKDMPEFINMLVDGFYQMCIKPHNGTQ